MPKSPILGPAPPVDLSRALASAPMSANNAAALEQAFAHAAESKLALLQRPDMLNGKQLGMEVGLSRATVDTRRQQGKLLALEFGSKRGYRFPLWQRELVQDGDIRARFEAVLNRLAAVGPWSRYRFFTQPAPDLDGQTPIEALRSGQGEAVLRAAESWMHGEQGGG